MLERMLAHTDGEARPSARPLGVTVERMRVFAAVARDVHTTTRWHCLSDEDLIHVEVPEVSAPFRHRGQP